MASVGDVQQPIARSMAKEQVLGKKAFLKNLIFFCLKFRKY
jgi:hypothetical protein